LICHVCDLIFSDPKFHLSTAAEKSRYDLHQNNPNDSNYLAFLRQVTKPLAELLEDRARGLDFGCGSGPAIATIFSESDITVTNYDPYYFNDESVFETKYDFVTATEVFEHISQPKAALDKVSNCLKKNAYLALMTSLHTNIDFENWYYKNDPTHIVFYSEKTMHWIAKSFAFEIVLLKSPVIIMRKNEN
jgi:2-polyprenyl-3-methyl-5-hydroxy-6-metoxy-1,4-benzoquinol methylase